LRFVVVPWSLGWLGFRFWCLGECCSSAGLLVRLMLLGLVRHSCLVNEEFLEFELLVMCCGCDNSVYGVSSGTGGVDEFWVSGLFG